MEEMKKVWDTQQADHVDIPEEMEAFLKDIAQACQKHGFSLAHEDQHGSFLIQRYNERNMYWLLSANKDYV